jgi:hypothetical protein
MTTTKNNLMNKILRISLAIAALVVMSQVAMAQPPPPPSNPAAVPIDGGLSLLLAAGAGLGIKKAYDARKAAQLEE